MQNRLIIHANPLRVHWPSLPVSQLLAHCRRQQVLDSVRLLFTLCGQGQQLAARLLLFPGSAPDSASAQQELVFETLRRLLADWLPAFAGRQASAAEWQALRQRQFVGLAQQLIYGQSAARWLAAGYPYWRQWIIGRQTVMARWIAALWSVQLPGVPLISEPDDPLLAVLAEAMASQTAAEISSAGVDQRALSQGNVQQTCVRNGDTASHHAVDSGEADNSAGHRLPAVEVSPLALEYAVFAQQDGEWRGMPQVSTATKSSPAPAGKPLAAGRLLARCVALARALSQPDSLRWRRFRYHDWQVAVVETARGWLTHQMCALSSDAERIDRYLITPPTRHHAQGDGVIRQTLAATAQHQWERQLLIIDPCVATEWC